jgi:hypothetical protein
VASSSVHGSASLTLYRVYNGAKTKSFEVFGVARIKHLNCVADQGDGQDSVESPFRLKSARFEVVFESVPHLKFETATLTTGFLPVEINYPPSVGRSGGALKHRWVSKRTVELDKHLVGKNPLAGSSQKFRNNLLSLRVLQRILVGSVDENVRIQAVHDRNQGSGQIFSIQRFPKIFGGTKNFPPSEGGYLSLRFIRLRASGQTLFDSTANNFAHRSVLQPCQSA